MKYLITLLFILSTNAQACPDYQKLDKGQVAPCEGHFFNNKKEELIRKDVRDSELKTQQLELKDIQIKRISLDRNNWRAEAENQAKISRSKDNDLTQGFLYGVGATVILIFVTGAVSK